MLDEMGWGSHVAGSEDWLRGVVETGAVMWSSLDTCLVLIKGHYGVFRRDATARVLSRCQVMFY